MNDVSRADDFQTLCAEFVGGWSVEATQRIEQFLPRVPEAQRGMLLKKLIGAEIQLMRQAEQDIDVGVYRKRFREFREDVDAVFRDVMTDRMDATVGGYHDERVDDVRDTSPPRKIGRYIVRRELGRGSFSVVFLADDPDLGRQVALKVPRMDAPGLRDQLDIFVDEARNAARLDHARIVKVYDIQQDQAGLYIVQQYVAGQNLKELAQVEDLSPTRIAELFVQIVEGVGHAHAHGLIHRDLKPANVLVDEQGNAYVADFGLALHESAQRRRRGESAGTYPYMSPEQVRGEAHRMDGRSDIWSLGVILYELLVGRRPFRGVTRRELVDEIEGRDPRPLRQIDSSIPSELARICAVCLEKRAADRYPATSDLLEDLRHWQSGATGSSTADAPSDGSSEQQAVAERVVPKGLISFDANDADFYLSLLPGPHDRDGLPKCLRFWKTQIELRDSDETFGVGIMYGPSGCGKTSLVRAGLLPRLATDIRVVYLEATANDTEARLNRVLEKIFPGLPHPDSLPDRFHHLRTHPDPRGDKVLIVLDQFEQWLHGCRDQRQAELLLALRQCDGAHLQSLLLVRDDFWMSITRCMQNLELRLIEGFNSAAVDLFELDHAENVLASFGHAFGKLSFPPTEDQRDFLAAAVRDIADEDRVICVRLAVFAEMMKGRPWTVETLRQVGGAEGVGMRFLTEMISSRSAPLPLRVHKESVQKVLSALLPDVDMDIRGRTRSRRELLQAAEYEHRQAEFDEVLATLDQQLKLITPADPDANEANAYERETVYQLSHDFLVPSLREWLTIERQSTRPGRARLCLDERAAVWKRRPEPRQLPTWWESVNIWLLARGNWTTAQRHMMGQAARYYGTRGTILLTLVVVMLALVGFMVRSGWTERTQTATLALRRARGAVVPHAIADLDDLPRFIVTPELRRQYTQLEQSEPGKMAVAYALANLGDESAIPFLLSRIPHAPPEEAANILRSARQHAAVTRALIPESIRQHAADDLAVQARFALLGLHVEQPNPAIKMCNAVRDPTPRSTFIDECSQWHGNLETLADVAAQLDAPAVRAALALAVGSGPQEAFTPEARQRWQTVLLTWSQDVSDPATQRGAWWALRRIGQPEAGDTQPAGRGDAHVRETGHVVMVQVPAGNFERQFTMTDPADSASKLTIMQSVTLSKPFWIADREVSLALFEQFVQDTTYEGEQPADWSLPDLLKQMTAAHPVHSVSWQDAVLFCNWLSWKEGLDSCYVRDESEWKLDARANGYRLPTEAEWEYACRAGSVTAYCFGDDEEKFLDAYVVCNQTEPEICGSKLPNRWGLFDMHGNVREWCSDWYEAEYGQETAVVDPFGPPSGTQRVSRGGSFRRQGRNTLSSTRGPRDPSSANIYLGFRVVRASR